MKTTHFFKLLFIIPLLLHFSCSSDNDDDSNQGTQNNDISISVDEYPSSGTFLSAIETDLSGDVDFNITSQTSGLALIITNNQLAVGDWLAFDYETNQTLIAVIEASNGTETETINVTVAINNVDDIWAFLNLHRGKLICLDEIQLMPEIFTQIRSFVDENKVNAQFLILGSASKILINQSAESLAGRIAYIEMTPFHLNEIMDENISQYLF